MININNKEWNDLESCDIKKFIDAIEGESFFVEFKNDEVIPKKLINEISALANTYGGYVFIGVEDNKEITGCSKWNEERIQNTIHDSITPTPNFDVHSFAVEDKTVLVIKIEEGTFPPYITKDGDIYERISSGTHKINTSEKLSQLFYKNEKQIEMLKNKIELEDINLNGIPDNLCGYIDLGFSLTSKDQFIKNIDDLDNAIRRISDVLNGIMGFSISRLGSSVYICLGKLEGKKRESILDSGIHNFIEIMSDGSIRSRIVIFHDINDSAAFRNVDVSNTFRIFDVFRIIYKEYVEDKFLDFFIEAKKYEKINIFKQFSPHVDFEKLIENEGYKINGSESFKEYSTKYFNEYKKIYGDNIIVSNNRFPKNNYFCVDKRFLLNQGKEYTADSVLNELFRSNFLTFGVLDRLDIDNFKGFISDAIKNKEKTVE